MAPLIQLKIGCNVLYKQVQELTGGKEDYYLNRGQYIILLQNKAEGVRTPGCSLCLPNSGTECRREQVLVSYGH